MTHTSSNGMVGTRMMLALLVAVALMALAKGFVTSPLRGARRVMLKVRQRSISYSLTHSLTNLFR